MNDVSLQNLEAAKKFIEAIKGSDNAPVNFRLYSEISAGESGGRKISGTIEEKFDELRGTRGSCSDYF